MKDQAIKGSLLMFVVCIYEVNKNKQKNLMFGLGCLLDPCPFGHFMPESLR